MSVVVIATIQPRDEHRAAVLAALMEAIPAVHCESGCELYALTEAPDRLVMVEQWTSEGHLDAHSKADAFLSVVKHIEDKLAGPMEVQVLKPAPTGILSKGQLRGPVGIE